MRGGFHLLGLCLLLSACEISTDDFTFKNVGQAIGKSICRSVSNCSVREPM
ncbi:MAG: hypothetical protein K2Q01_00880 [Rickettsiales bacterium]|nr:hypothetical protein [Rickettsiales bacterium]